MTYLTAMAKLGFQFAGHSSVAIAFEDRANIGADFPGSFFSERAYSNLQIRLVSKTDFG
jgi:hypothetical protein